MNKRTDLTAVDMNFQFSYIHGGNDGSFEYKLSRDLTPEQFKWFTLQMEAVRSLLHNVERCQGVGHE